MTNWDDLEHDWRFGTLSNVKLGEKYQVTEGAIRKRAKAEGWQKGVERTEPRQDPKPVKTQARPRETTKPAAVIEEQPPMEMTLDVAKRMLAELDFYSAHLDELEDDIYAETSDDRSGKRRAAMLKAVSLNTRAMTLKTIQQTLAAAEAGKTPEGKKEQRQAAAAAVAQSSGRFAAARAPLSLVKQ